MPIYSSDSDEQPETPIRLFDHQKSIHALLGGGKVADILLWRNKYVSAAILIGFTIIWFLFEVLEYHFVTLLCYSMLFLMLAIFIWSNGAGYINWNPPDVDKFTLSEHTVRSFHSKINTVLSTFYRVSRGEDLALLGVAIVTLLTLSVIGDCFSSLNVLYIGFLCMETLPALYERYEEQVDEIADKGNRNVKKLYRKFDSHVLNKIPRGPVKEKKFR
ncbi:hypothetical protein VitviT2T_000325 [Vitis vinifera]|nr:reticulon-like protein B9 [Vitis vinifera]WJZ80402.1 hypothetical protein VitviT2T_000325 [Vitis vinifera]|eukprot:XP_002282955.1 PREDICTED: reticulon-like protein B9 isoform X2 [Vitis vinifera]